MKIKEEIKKKVLSNNVATTCIYMPRGIPSAETRVESPKS